MAEEQFSNNPDNPEPPKKKRAPAKTTKVDAFSADDCMNKLFIIYAFFCKTIFRVDMDKKVKDFAERGDSLARLSQQYPFVGVCIKAFDPFVFIIGTINDYVSPFTTWNERRKQKVEMKKQAKAAQQSGVVVLNYGDQGNTNHTNSFQQ